MAENWADTTRTVEYEKAVTFALNEMPGKLWPLAASVGAGGGKKVQIEDRFDDLYAEEISERNGDTRNTDPDVNRRWIVKPKRAGVAPLLDPDDEMSTEVGLQSPLATGVAKAIRRFQDDKFLEGFYGTAYTGEEGATAVPFKAANILAADYSTTGTPSGLTTNKLIRLKRMATSAFVDLEAEKLHMIVTAAQIEDLFKITQYQSADYNTVKPLADGKLVDWMGFRFIPAEIDNPKAYKRSSGLTVDGNGYRRVPVFVPSGMHRRTWLDFKGKLDERSDKNHSLQIAGYTCAGATRLLEDKCFQMLCIEAP
ncbi:phage capsid protein [Sphingomonas oligoaromativorans]|uniref:phage capsid protein n=1 Tax=Sphingomonas oligoaromativorans TaxID=575322 RepID=UPI001421835F|nr:phage capsid protein [Sphingomonas oligoaromativorans]NIJ34334.1 hypothetical protein [Sphingomonas oligoaromativorans]